jgi:hypothetical protein
MLEEAGAGAFAVTFTRIHPGEPPMGTDIDAWNTLVAADDR